jgi:hypothetical protein
VILCAALSGVLAGATPLFVVQALELSHPPEYFSKKDADDLKADFWRMLSKTGVAYVETNVECRLNPGCLRASAVTTNTLYALSSKVDIAVEGTVTATSWVVRTDGEVVKTSVAEASMKPDNFAEISKVALAESIQQLELSKLPKANECVPDKIWLSNLKSQMFEMGVEAANKYERESWRRYDAAENKTLKLLEDAVTSKQCSDAQKSVSKLKRDFKL